MRKFRQGCKSVPMQNFTIEVLPIAPSVQGQITFKRSHFEIKFSKRLGLGGPKSP